MQPLVLIECPRLLFPFAREIIATSVRNGGFPPLMLDPIDFVALYQQRLAQQTPPQPVGLSRAVGQIFPPDRRLAEGGDEGAVGVELRPRRAATAAAAAARGSRSRVRASPTRIDSAARPRLVCRAPISST